MSNPHLYVQLEYIEDRFYLMDCDIADEINDRGGVHYNNCVFSKICYDMYKSGISMEDDYDV